MDLTVILGLVMIAAAVREFFRADGRQGLAILLFFGGVLVAGY